MKKYLTLAFILLSAAVLPVHSASAAQPSAVSFAEDIPERDPMEHTQPALNESAPAASESSATEESSSLPDLDTPMIFQSGERGRGDVEDIIAYWEENGYPENLSFIAETRSEMIDGVVYTNYDIGLVLATEEKCEEILDIAANNCVIRFTTGTTALWERECHFEKLCYLSVQEKDLGFLEVRLYKNSDMIEVVVSGSEKTYYERFSKQFGGVVVFVNERNAVTGIDNAGFVPGNSENKVADYTEKTANAEIFHAASFLAVYPNGWIGDSPIELGADLDGVNTIGIGGSGADLGLASPFEGTIGIAAEPSAEKSVPIWLFVAGAAAVILAAIAAVTLRMRFKAGADGTAAAHGSAENKIIAAIKSAEEHPDPRLLEKIKDNITK